MIHAKKLGLGTVQWGLPYGVSNKKGQTSEKEVGLILNEARHYGINLLDTASLYGTAEAVLGKNNLDDFRIITKTPSFNKISSSEKKNDALFNTFQRSLKDLSVNKVYGLLIHHANDILTNNGNQLIDAMRTLQSNGQIEKLGISIYDEQQLDAVLEKFKPDIVQLPLNILDQRLLISGHISNLKSLGVEIHVRSVFLQGLLLTPIEQLHDYFNPIRDHLIKYHQAACEQGFSLTQAALSYVRDIAEIDRVLIGIENLEQLQKCVQGFSTNKTFDTSGLVCGNSDFINPSSWKLS